MKEKEFDKFFRDNLIDIEETPSPQIWNKIEQELNNTPVVSIRKKKSIWFYTSSAAAILLALSFSYMFLNQSNEIDKTKTIAHNSSFEQNQIVEPKLKTTESLLHESTVTLENKNVLVSSNTDKKTHQPHIENIVTEEKIEKENHVISEKLFAKTELNSQVTESKLTELTVINVTEIEDIKPLVQLDEEVESMYANNSNSKTNSNVVLSVLNKISENIDVLDNNIRFSADEEGSVRVDLINSLVKNRFKKRK